jgi:hypothetical protein
LRNLHTHVSKQSKISRFVFLFQVKEKNSLDKGINYKWEARLRNMGHLNSFFLETFEDGKNECTPKDDNAMHSLFHIRK